MQYKNTVEAIYISLDEIQKIVSQMGAEGQINIIDIDLAADKIRHVYDLMLQLKNEGQPASKNAIGDVNKVEEQTKNAEGSIENKNESVLELDPEPKTGTVEMDVTNDTVIDGAHQKTQAEIDSRVKSIKEKKFLSDSFEGKTKSLNEELSSRSGSGKITDKLSSKPIPSISSAIGINEKFEIINNLFKGNSEAYEQTLQVLNSAANFNEAYDYMSKKLKWEMDDPQVQRILELIRRKLIIKKNEG